MNELVLKVEFWVAMVAAAILKFKASPPVTPLGAVSTIVAGVCTAMICTGPIADWLALESENIRYAIAGLLMLTAEHFSRSILSVKLSDMLKLTGGK